MGMLIATESLVQAERYSLTDLGSLGGGRSGATAINNLGEGGRMVHRPGEYLAYLSVQEPYDDEPGHHWGSTRVPMASMIRSK
ncbi:MAG: hypothetical protein OJF50_001745 [Nitrospira sp.]|jgi:hypothetical protein|nr:hypothetical protein [Nitrospira sp.]